MTGATYSVRTYISVYEVDTGHVRRGASGTARRVGGGAPGGTVGSAAARGGGVSATPTAADDRRAVSQGICGRARRRRGTGRLGRKKAHALLPTATELGISEWGRTSNLLVPTRPRSRRKAYYEYRCTPPGTAPESATKCSSACSPSTPPAPKPAPRYPADRALSTPATFSAVASEGTSSRLEMRPESRPQVPSSGPNNLTQVVSIIILMS